MFDFEIERRIGTNEDEKRVFISAVDDKIILGIFDHSMHVWTPLSRGNTLE